MTEKSHSPMTTHRISDYGDRGWAKLDIAVAALEQIQREDYRGPRPRSIEIAEEALERIEEITA